MGTNYSTSAGLVSVEGLASGLDISGIIAKISAARSQPIQSLQTQRAELQDRLSVFQSLETYVLSLQTAALSAAAVDVYGARKVSVSGADPTAAAPLVASADAAAPIGSHSIVINKLAQAHRVRSASVAAADEALGLSGDLLINGRVITLQADDTLADLAAAINSAGAQVQATVLHVAADDHRLVLTGLQTGAANALDLVDANSDSLLESLGLVGSTTTVKHALAQGAASDGMSSAVTSVGTALGLQTAAAGTVQINGTDVAMDLSVDSLQDLAQRITANVAGVTATVQTVTEGGTTTHELRVVGDSETPTFSDAGNVLVTLGLLAKPVANEIQAAQDAEVVLDQQTITRATNSLDDVLEGLSLQLVQADPARTLTLTVSANLEPAVSAVRQLVQRYNAVVDFIAANQSFDPDTGEGGAFLASYDVVHLESNLRQAFTLPVQGLVSGTVLASQIGITTDQSDHLVLDETELRTALSDDPQAVRRLFTVTSETTSSSVQYVSSTRATQPSTASGYAVTITQAATRARAESAALAAGISVNETLTVNSEWQVNLYSGMTLEQAVQALNNTFALAGLSPVSYTHLTLPTILRV